MLLQKLLFLTNHVLSNYTISRCFLCISLQRGIFPGTGDLHDIGAHDGEGYTVNVPLPPASGESAALQAHEEVLLPRMEQFDPDFVRACNIRLQQSERNWEKNWKGKNIKGEELNLEA